VNGDIKLTGYLIMGVFVLMIIAINVGLFSAILKNKTNRMENRYRSVIDTAKSPWQDEDESLHKLDQLVNALQDNHQQNRVNKQDE